MPHKIELNDKHTKRSDSRRAPSQILAQTRKNLNGFISTLICFTIEVEFSQALTSA